MKERKKEKKGNSSFDAFISFSLCWKLSIWPWRL